MRSAPTPALDVNSVPLAGVNLVEAGAGTGKTWTITSIAVRLLLEAGLRIDQVLVVTYTRAATAEMRHRLRQRLIEIRNGLLGGPARDEFSSRIVDEWSSASQRAAGVRRLSDAIRNFDEARIYTIHGFCERVLGELSIETATPFDTDVIANEDDLVFQIADDYWRSTIYHAPLSAVSELVRKGVTVDRLLRYTSAHLGKPYLAVVGPAASSPVDTKRLRYDLFRYCDAELLRRKRRLGVRSYADLLNCLASALDGPAAPDLIAALRSRYPAALVDEFQDTDPVQYRIFERIYGGSGCPVFLVGDPKQAIYGFRGADVFSYLAAKPVAASCSTLTACRRSAPGLVDALNVLFQASPRPFLIDRIACDRATADPVERGELTIDGATGAALRIWLLRPEDDKLINKGEANRAVAEATAAEISRLLSLAGRGRAAIGERPLRGGDMAVLAPTHQQSKLVREALSRRNVPSVQCGQGSVYESREARELELVLGAIADPGNEPRVRAAMATELMGHTAADLYRLREDHAWELCSESFRAHHDLWRTKGFGRAFRAWLDGSRVAERLLGTYQDGERRLANVLHLGERLDSAASEHSTIEALMAWYATYRRRPDPRVDEELLRLESDASLVKLLTVHSAKGLEFPIVFCPFAWDGRLWARGEPDAAVLYHDPRRAGAPVIEIGGASEEGRRLAEVEKLAETMRVLYVALTRAKHRCYAVCGKIRGFERSGLAWLLYGRELTSDPAPVTSLIEMVKPAPAGDLESRLARIVGESSGAIALDPLPDFAEDYVAPPGGQLLAARVFGRTLEPTWSAMSYSSLVHRADDEARDHDAGLVRARPAEEPAAGTGILGFPRGPRAGSCLHAVFETLDFAITDRARLEGHVHEFLLRFGLGPEHAPVVADMVERVLDVALDGRSLRLRGIPASRRAAELEFLFTVNTRGADDLVRALTDPTNALHAANVTAARELDIGRMKGFMKGFVDLVIEHDGRFFILDYKSNWLGNSIEDYAPDRLLGAIAAEHYYLQYLIYTVALHRYLGLRLPDYDYERNFGGVFYLFLRGVRREHDNRFGVYFDRPARALVEALERALAGQK
ncbi:MAG: UvrD-helicase domain-containing protein [Acidobacteriota bacterium]